MLYALRFDVAIEHPFGTMLAALRRPALTRVWQEWGQAHPGSVSFQQMCINLLNDRYWCWVRVEAWAPGGGL